MNKKYRYGEERSCAICLKRFKPRDKGTQQKCCSNECRGALQTRKAMKNCSVCGKEFLPSRPIYNTCSRACGVAFRISRREIDPMVDVRRRLAVFCCSSIARCLRNKTDRTRILLGYSTEELRAHLEKHFQLGMTWENYGKGKDQWSIDHTRPISSFATTAKLAEINALENLRPMWHSQNCSKKNKWKEGL